MATFVTFRRCLLAITALAVTVGCATNTCDCNDRVSCNRCPLGAVACGLYHGELADEVMCCDVGCLSQSHGVGACMSPGPLTCGPDCQCCRKCGIIPLGLAGPLIEKPQPGPPPITFRPQVPPKFLAVPTHPVISPVRPEAPEPTRGNVEVGYEKVLTVPGND